MESEKSGNYHTQLLFHEIYNQTQVKRTRERFFVTPILVRTFSGLGLTNGRSIFIDMIEF